MGGCAGGSGPAAPLPDAGGPALDLAKKRASAKRILAAEPIPLPDWDELKAELDEARAGGQ